MNTASESAISQDTRSSLDARLGHNFEHVQIFGSSLHAAGEVGESPAPAPTPTPAEPEEKPQGNTIFLEPKHVTYTVKGSTLAEAHADISKRKEAGDTKATPQARWQTFEGRVINAQVTVPMTITMPSWPGAERLSPAAKAEWDRVYAALEEHENGHRAIFNTQFAGLAESLNGKTEEEASLALKEAETKVLEATEAYDLETDHGKKTGTLLNTTIE